MRAEDVAGSTEPFEPGTVFGAELFFEFGAKVLGESGAFAVGGDGDLEIATLDDGAVVEMAVVDVVDRVAEDVAALGFGEYRGIEFGHGGSSDDQECSEEIFGHEGFGMPVDFAAADVFGELGREFGGDDADAGAGVEKTREFFVRR